jgi:hypothetical protein
LTKIVDGMNEKKGYGRMVAFKKMVELSVKKISWDECYHNITSLIWLKNFCVAFSNFEK